MKNSWLIFGSLLLGACATSGYQTRSVLDSPPDVPRKVRLEYVTFMDQSERGYCGPSSLSMALQAAGQSASPESLAEEIYSEKHGGSLQAELVATARKRGLLAVQIEGLANVLKEIAAGHPVILFENLGIRIWPKWHYSVAVGYDLDEQELILHTGHIANRSQSLNRFERGWKLAGYWGLVVLPVDELAEGAGELGNLQGALGLEQAGHVRDAEKVYTHVLQKWPNSLAARVALGNLAYARGDFAGAVKHLKQAVKAHPDSQAARHNLAVAIDIRNRKL